MPALARDGEPAARDRDEAGGAEPGARTQHCEGRLGPSRPAAADPDHVPRPAAWQGERDRGEVVDDRQMGKAQHGAGLGDGE